MTTIGRLLALLALLLILTSCGSFLPQEYRDRLARIEESQAKALEKFESLGEEFSAGDVEELLKSIKENQEAAKALEDEAEAAIRDNIASVIEAPRTALGGAGPIGGGAAIALGVVASVIRRRRESGS